MKIKLGWVGTFVAASVSLLFGMTTSSAWALDDFKGQPSSDDITVGALAGLGIVNTTGGLALLGTVARKIIHQGFVPDINNQVFIETELGPLFAAGQSPFVYSVHMRWDFQKDNTWTFYGLGGLGGSISKDPTGFQLFPRFGAGAFYRVDSALTLRGEVSHEWTALGVSYAF